jgi:cyclase
MEGVNLPKRLVARIDVKNEFLVKGIQMEGLRKLGDPFDFVQRYSKDGIDEIVIIDVVASLYSRKHIFHLIEHITSKLRIPVTVIGGIQTIQDAKAVFDSGADKVGINSRAVRDQKILLDIADIYGSQAVVNSIEAKFVAEDKTWYLYTESGRNNSQIKLVDWFEKIKYLELGEIFLSSVDSDGLRRGPDLSLISTARDLTELPLVYSGGIRKNSDILDVFKLNVEAVAIGAALHFGDVNVVNMKNMLFENGVRVRLLDTK